MMKLKKKLMRVTGDRDKKKKQKSAAAETQLTPQSTAQPTKQTVEKHHDVPVTSIDDVVFEEYRPFGKLDGAGKNASASTSHAKSDDARNEPTAAATKSANDGKKSSAGGARDTAEARAALAEFEPRAEKKAGYLRSLKNRLMRGAPKKNDTDTFLNELSAQFDDEMNLLGDVAILEEEPKRKFGEKWSYTRKSPAESSSSPSATTLNVHHFQQLCDAAPPEPVTHLAAAPATVQDYRRALTRSRLPSTTPPSFPVMAEDRLDFLERPTDHEPTTADPSDESKDQDSPSGSRRVRRRRRRRSTMTQGGTEDQDPPMTRRSIVDREYVVAPDEPARRISDPCPEILLSPGDAAANNNPPMPYIDDDVIYDVPKVPLSATLRRERVAHVNVQRRARQRQRSSTHSGRPLSVTSASRRDSASDARMQVWMSGDGGEQEAARLQQVQLRRGSATVDETFFEKAKKRNYRVSGVSMNMEDIFSEAEEDLQSRAPPPDSAPPPPCLIDKIAPADPDEIYAPLQEDALAMGLAYDEDDRDEDDPPQSPPPMSSVGTNTIEEEVSAPPADNIPIPPPPPILVPPPPPPPPPPPMLFRSTAQNPNQQRMSVKRINWEKIEPADLESTVWGQLGEDHETINDVVKYLDLEEHFAMKKATKQPKVVEKTLKKPTAAILSHKKAYNLSILLAHLKLTHDEIYNCMLFSAPEQVRKRLDSSHYSQLLMYCPDDDEAGKCQSFAGNPKELNEADQLAVKVFPIPGYQLRLKALVFKLSFTEKEEEIRRNLEVIQSASNQLRKSRKLAKILEFVLAMGNYMNQGHIRISKATGFRIHFIAEMDCTKTSDNKLTFLHILARAVSSKFPDVTSFADELNDVKGASRVVYPAVLEDLQNLRTSWLDIRDHLDATASKNKQDRFKIAMETCLVRTNSAIKRLEQLHQATVKEFKKVAQYFGENPKNIGMQQFFKIFDEFIRKFQRSHGEIRNLVKKSSES